MAKKRLLGLEPPQVVQLVGLVAAMVIAVTVNVLASRHYRRWDWTSAKLYTLSPATLATLHDLPEPVEVWILLGTTDALGQSVRQLMATYAGETSKLDLHFIDPDRDALALLDVRKRFKIEAGKTEDGHVVTDAVMVFAHGDRHWFLSPTDMVEYTEADETRAKPKEEKAITGAIRSVTAGDKARLCFTAGHGELSLADGGPQGLGVFKDLVEKDNYEVATIDTTAPDAIEPFKGCALVVIAGPRGPFAKDEEARLATYLTTGGGNLLVAVSPLVGSGPGGLDPPGLGAALAPFGIGLDEDVVFERDPKMVIPKEIGAFIVDAKPHAVTGALVRNEGAAREPPRILVKLARSLRHVDAPGAASASDLLVTSGSAFGAKDITGASRWPIEGPEKGSGDLAGPLVVAMASERPKLSPGAPHGPRVVVIGTASVMAESNWREAAPFHGAAFVVENAISWLAAHPQILDVPDKPSVPAGIHVSEESRAQVWRYVLLYMPFAAALLAFGVALRRRSTEGKPLK